MAFLASFIQYLVIFIILVGIALLGVFLGKIARNKKDAKDAAKAALETASDVNVTEIEGDADNDK